MPSLYSTSPRIINHHLFRLLVALIYQGMYPKVTIAPEETDAVSLLALALDEREAQEAHHQGHHPAKRQGRKTE